MKKFLLCLVILLAASQYQAFDSSQFIDASLQSTLGWSYNYQTCKDKAASIYQKYTNLLQSLTTLNTGTITSKHNSLIEAYTASPRCYYFTSVPSIFVQGSVFRVIWIELYNTPIKFLLKPMIYAWSFIALLPSDIMDASALILDVISVFKGSFTSATLGYLAGFVARAWYREFYFPGY